MKNKKFLSGALAAALALSLTTPALAAGYPPPLEGDREQVAQSDTTISIFESKADITQLSFEVPLYVTMAVVDQKTQVVTPDNYGIFNTSGDGAGNAAKFDIGVIGVSFTKLPGSTYNTTGSTAPATATDIKLSIGGVWMPALNAAGALDVDLGDTASYTGATGVTALYQQGAGKPEPISPNTFFKLPITGEVTAAQRNNNAAVAQFKVNYTVAALDDDGNPIGAVYTGNNSVDAGLGQWTGPNQWAP